MRNLLVGFSVLTTALLLGTGCSDEGVTVIGAPEVETGRAVFALTGGGYTLAATVGLFDDDGLVLSVPLDGVGETVTSDPIEVGSYTMFFLDGDNLADDDVFTLTDGVDPVAATFVNFNPNPVGILADDTTPVAINFTVGEEVITVEPPPDPQGDAEFTLVVGETCGALPACVDPLECAQVGEGDPFCGTTCDPDNVGGACNAEGLTGECLREAAPGTGGICEVDPA